MSPPSAGTTLVVPETGFPKIRNPNLVGVACKHVLRVMSEIEGGNAVQAFLARAIEKGRKNGDGAGHIRQLQKEAERLADKQAKRPMASNARDSGDRDFDRARRALRRQSRATTTKPKRAAKGSRRAAALGATPSARDKLMAVAKELGISPDQAAAIFRAAANDQP